MRVEFRKKSGSRRRKIFKNRVKLVLQDLIEKYSVQSNQIIDKTTINKISSEVTDEIAGLISERGNSFFDVSSLTPITDEEFIEMLVKETE